MKYPSHTVTLLCLLTLSLAGCAVPGAPQSGNAPLSATQCRDLTALKNGAPLTRERNLSELSALEKAGYQPSPFFDPYYPDDLQAAQQQVDRWYEAQCRGMQPG